MKVSIVTVSFNAGRTIARTLRSVAEQSHADLEHLVIDGGSTDETRSVVERDGARVAHFVSEPDRGLYDAMNKGLALATGDVVAFLNADDAYAHEGVVERAAGVLADNQLDACHANLVYLDPHDRRRVVRVWHSRQYAPGLFRRGWMPAHPTLFVRRRIFERHGNFDIRFRQQADFDLTMRFFEVAKLRSTFIPEYWVEMLAGGVSNRSVGHVLRGNLEAWEICRKNQLRVPPWFMLIKIGSRLPQFIPGRASGYRANFR